MSTWGSMVLGIGLLVALFVLLRSVGAFSRLGLASGKRAPANPWGGATLEWQCTSPPPFYNFERAPSVGDPYDFSNLEWDSEDERYVTVEPEREIVPEEQPEAAPVHADDSN